LDDASSDGTADAARRAAAGDSRFTVVTSPERRFALGSIVEGIRRIAGTPDDVVILVDGDDWLHGRAVLETLARAYADPEVWMTYGSHVRWKGGWRDRLGLRQKRGISAPYPEEAARARRYRGLPWSASHLRTFRRFLWDAVRDQDLRGEDGAYLRVCYDLAIMFPMLEMAGPEHARYLPDLLYVYNHANPGSVHHTRLEEQVLTAARLRLAPPYPPLPSRPPVRP
jgi:glycosyltransferase involved in cell wall biosynthesis